MRGLDLLNLYGELGLQRRCNFLGRNRLRGGVVRPATAQSSTEASGSIGCFMMHRWVGQSAGRPDTARRGPAAFRLPGGCLAGVVILHGAASVAQDWPGYERLSRDQLVAAVAKSSQQAPAEMSSKNLSGLDLSGVDFKGANLTATVFNRAILRGATLAGCNLTVSFGEGADFRQANLRDAQMFSMQLAGADLRGADLTGARFIGDMNHARLEGATLKNLRGGADMRNQSMGLMNARFNSAALDRADLSGADVSRADFSFAHLSGARLAGAKAVRADFSGADLSGADLSNADLSESTFIDTDFTSARLQGARFGGSVWRNARGLTAAAARGATGIPPDSLAPSEKP